MPSKRALEAGIALFLFAAAFWFGSEQYAKQHHNSWFYQGTFGPAVTIACGEGFQDVDWGHSSKLTEFLRTQSDTFDCRDLPVPIPIRKIDFSTVFMKGHLYLISSVGAYWKLTGEISWSGLDRYAGAIYGAFIVACYAIFRLGMGRTAAFLSVLLLLVSVRQADFLIHLRDYSKVPFIAALMALTGLLAVHSLTRKQLFLAAFLFGVLTGIGMGFRQDVVICVPPFLLTLFFFRPKEINLRVVDAFFATAIMIVALMSFAYPLFTEVDGANSWHVALLGLHPLFSLNMGIEPSPFYQWFNAPSDGYAWHITNAFYSLNIENTTLLRYPSKAYDAAGFTHYVTIVKTFPADFLARHYASMATILDLPFHVPGPKSPVSGDLYAFLHTVRRFITAPLEGAGPYIAFIAIVIVAAIGSLRLSLFVALFIYYFSGYPLIQFTDRHLVYLEFIGLWAMGFSLHHIIVGISALYHSWRSGAMSFPPWRPTVRAAAVGLLLPLFLIGALLVAREYQERHLLSLFEKITIASAKQLPITAIDWENKRVVGRPEFLGATGREEYVDTYYLIAKFDLNRCNKEKVFGRTFYYSLKGSNDFTAPFTLQSGRSTLIFPVFDSYITTYTGLVFSQGEEDCLVELSRVTDVSDFPLPLYLNLPDDWRDRQLYEKIVRFER